MERFHIDWIKEDSGKVRVNINYGALIDAFMSLDNKYIARTWAINAQSKIEDLRFKCTMQLDEDRVA